MTTLALILIAGLMFDVAYILFVPGTPISNFDRPDERG